ERINASARNLHETPELLQAAFLPTAQPCLIVRNTFLQKGSAKMTSLSSMAPDIRPAKEYVFPVKLAITLSLASLSDWLFYGQRIGISAAIFAIALTCGSLLANFSRLNGRQTLLAGILVLAGLVPAIEEFNAASSAFIVLALGVGLLLTTGRELDGLKEQVADLCDLLLIGAF